MSKKNVHRLATESYGVPDLNEKALSAAIWRLIVDREDVQEFRRRWTNGAPLKQADPWLKANPKGSPAFDALEGLSAKVAGRIRISANAAARAILRDERPAVPKVEVMQTDLGMDATATTRIVLSVRADASGQEVAKAYMAARNRAIGSQGHRAKPLSEKHLSLALFYADRGDAAFDARGLIAWNLKHPEWRYLRSALKTYHRDLKAAYTRVLNPTASGLMFFAPIGPLKG